MRLLSIPRSRTGRALVAGVIVTAVAAGGVYAIGKHDPGAAYEAQLGKQSKVLYGFGHPLDEAIKGEFSGPGARAVELAGGLSARVTTSTVGQVADMIALWPDDRHPKYAIVCNEIDGSGAGSPATVQRVRLSDGHVSDMIFGHVSCDPAHRTSWGTVVVGEESGTSGRLWEILDPLAVDGSHRRSRDRHEQRPDACRGTHSARPAQLRRHGPPRRRNHLLRRRAAPVERQARRRHLQVRAADAVDGSEPITSLPQSPLASGTVHACASACVRVAPDFGQGSNTGAGTWVPLATPANPTTFNLASTALAAGGYTGYYRPEDMDLDPVAAADGRTRLCWNNTGNDQQANWGETLCLEDVADRRVHDRAQAGGHAVRVGNPELRMPDNLDFQPGTGILYINMDATTSVRGPVLHQRPGVGVPSGRGRRGHAVRRLRPGHEPQGRRGRVQRHHLPGRREELPHPPPAPHADRPRRGRHHRPAPRHGTRRQEVASSTSLRRGRPASAGRRSMNSAVPSCEQGAGRRSPARPARPSRRSESHNPSGP